MDHVSLTPATQAVLDALTALGQGNVHELSERSGKARSTTDRAIKTLADAGLIVPGDSDADPAEGTPTRWTLSEGVAAEAQDRAFSTDADRGDGDPAGGEDYTDIAETDEPDTDPAENRQAEDDDANGDDVQPGDEPDGAGADQDRAEVDEADQGDANDHDTGEDTDDPGNSDDDADEDDSHDEDSDKGDSDKGNGGQITVVQPSRPGDRKVMTIKAVLSEHGDDGAAIGEIVAESGIGEATVSRLLTAMEQADAARRLPGVPARWIAGPTKASEVNPNPEPPRCPLCFQVIRGLSESPEAVAQVQPLVRPDGTLHIVAEDGTVHTVALPKRTPTRTPGLATAGARRTDVTANADGSQPFAKGELERLTFDTLKANPGRTMTPQEIATAISNQLGGRTVSAGAVRNNCGKLGAAGRIVMVSESPWAFQYPRQAEDGGADQADDATAEQS
ncbi:helix-turn-helix domain-containing protein [Micromonospora sp. NPDC126480]|uniref:helix-turn-helix domain-containing protein n=1 Tax=Micromonospora sp. NPDC126480 TaxID=3155312 RepID=UPI00332F6047